MGDINMDLVMHDSHSIMWLGTHGDCDASDLTAGHNRELLGRVWNDSCDEGFMVQSHRTSDVLCFVVTKTTSNDDELLSWELESVGFTPKLTITVHND